MADFSGESGDCGKGVGMAVFQTLAESGTLRAWNVIKEQDNYLLI